ncbi:cellulose biosynthesis protein BcsN [Bosea sp. CS1GBMeth4]|uniref:cellulose biosynthesis protein BcsN n=1 Tax=Bosea sp. CS1GBMeth4 TaxID=1892849 RepID=UPI001646EAE0|nr:cellulose biosynthesis protein BcsN [Bosea sp. CS1GBMeth4]
MRIICIADRILAPLRRCPACTGVNDSLTNVNRWSMHDGAQQPPPATMTIHRRMTIAAREGLVVLSARRTILLWVAASALFLAGCGEQRLSESELSFSSRAIAVDPSRALVVLPPGSPAVIGVTQRNYDNAVAQTIALSTRGRTPGENAIQVAFFTAEDLPDSAGVEGNLLKLPGIDDFAVAQDMEGRLPGVAMALSAVFVQNKYGPFGYAFGRGAGGEACLYAWQRIAAGDSLFRPKSGAVSVRMRICDPMASEASLLRLAYEYSLNASLRRSGWDPVGDAPAPDPGLGKAGAPIYPLPQASAPETAVPRRAARPRPARVPQAETIDPPAARPVPDRPLEGYPTVPPPPTP